jgi:excisionase family DNA binding protein
VEPGAYPNLTVDAVAQLLGVHAETVRRRIRAGAWRAYRVAGQWRMCPNDVDAIAYGEPNTPTVRAAVPEPRRRRAVPGVAGSVHHLDEIERELRGTG